MAELLEFNLRAKKAKPPQPPPQAATEGLVLEVGKKYITNSGLVVEMQVCAHEHYTQMGFLAACIPGDTAQEQFYWYPDGRYVGDSAKAPRSIRREWTPTWELEEAWMRGEKLEYFESMDGVWRLWNPYFYTLIQNTFGKDSITTKEFWAKSYASQCIRTDGTFRVRRKP
jgi:hypothetical protein